MLSEPHRVDNGPDVGFGRRSSSLRLDVHDCRSVVCVAHDPAGAQWRLDCAARRRRRGEHRNVVRNCAVDDRCTYHVLAATNRSDGHTSEEPFPNPRRRAVHSVHRRVGLDARASRVGAARCPVHLGLPLLHLGHSCGRRGPCSRRLGDSLAAIAPKQNPQQSRWSGHALRGVGGRGLELLAGPDDEVSGTATLRSVTFTAVEELGEMLALSLFIVALLELQRGRRIDLGFVD